MYREEAAAASRERRWPFSAAARWASTFWKVPYALNCAAVDDEFGPAVGSNALLPSSVVCAPLCNRTCYASFDATPPVSRKAGLRDAPCAGVCVLGATFTRQRARRSLERRRRYFLRAAGTLRCEETRAVPSRAAPLSLLRRYPEGPLYCSRAHFASCVGPCCEGVFPDYITLRNKLV